MPAILARGGDWFRDQGLNGAHGLKVIALSGDVKRPGVYEIPLGLPARELIERHGGGPSGGPLKAFCPGGASAGFLPASLLDTPLEFNALAKLGSMLGSGAVVAIGPDRWHAGPGAEPLPLLPQRIVRQVRAHAAAARRSWSACWSGSALARAARRTWR